MMWALRGEFRRAISGADEYLSQSNHAYAKSILIQRALAYYYSGAADKALSDLKRSVAVDPKDWTAIHAVFWYEIIARRHRLPELESSLKDAVLRTADKLPTALLLGRGTRADIEARPKEESKKGPDHRRYMSCDASYWGGLWSRLQDHRQDAIEYLRRADQDCPKDPDDDYLRNWRAWAPGVELKALLDGRSPGQSSPTPAAQTQPSISSPQKQAERAETAARDSNLSIRPSASQEFRGFRSEHRRGGRGRELHGCRDALEGGGRHQDVEGLRRTIRGALPGLRICRTRPRAHRGDQTALTSAFRTNNAFDGRCALWSFSGAFAASASVRPFTGARMDGRPNGNVSTMAPKSSPPRKDPDVHKVERLEVPYSTNARGIRQRRRRRDAARARHSLYRAQSRRELPRPARQHRQLPRQRAAADAAVPARGGSGRDRARLRQGHRQADGGGGALQRRPDARHDGDLQRLVRPHAGPDPRRHRPGRRHEAPSVDRLDPHRRRPGRDHPQLHQVGRPAGVGRRRARVGAARLLARQHRALRPDLHQPRRRGAGGQARRAAAGDRLQALHAAGHAPARPPNWSSRRPTCCSRPSVR